MLVYTHDNFLLRKIELSLPSGYTAVRKDVFDKASDFELILFDGRLGACNIPTAIVMDFKEDADLVLPFSILALERILCERKEIPLAVNDAARMVSVRGEVIKLTELEYALFSLLYERGGEFVSREAILNSVWHDSADKGIINVYVHYLREKLEAGGEKIIVSSRREGYAIDKRFFQKSL